MQFLNGLHPELKTHVNRALAVIPQATLDQTVELARCLSDCEP